MTREYQSGWSAFAIGAPLSGNPYVRGMHAWGTWRKGWFAARRLDQRQRSVSAKMVGG
jgi:hypothetical protein